MGKGRGDDSSSSSDETDAKVKKLWYLICLLTGLVLVFAGAVAMLVWAKQQSGKTTALGSILPATAGYTTLGQLDLREFDEPQIIQVTHPNANGLGTDNTVIYCTSGIGLPNAEVPCESSNIMYNDASRFRMSKNGAYACIFCTDGELCSSIVEQHYAINSKPPTIQPLADKGTTQLSLQKKKFELSFTVAYRWEIMAATESIVYYTNASTTHGGSVDDCDKISDADFEQCPNYPLVPCWPPVIKASRASKIFRYDDKNRPLMDSSVCVGAITKVRDMNVGTQKPRSISYSEMRYLVEEVAEVRVEPCLQDQVAYTSYTKDITMWSSTPGAKIKYTIDYASTCLGVISGKGKNPLSADPKASCDRVLRDAKGATLSSLWTKAPKMLNPASDSSAQTYSNPISIPHTARLLAVGTHPSAKINNGMLTVCDYEVVVAAPTCTEEAGSSWMQISSPTGAPQAPKTNTNSAVVRFLSPTKDSTVWFQYCDQKLENCAGKTWKYDPKNPPILYQSAQIKAWSTKSKLRTSSVIRCNYLVKSAPPIFSPPSSYLELGEAGGTWKPEGCTKASTPDSTGAYGAGCTAKLDKVVSPTGSPSAGGPAAPGVVPGVPTSDSFFTLNTMIQISQWSYSQCDDSRANAVQRGCLHADHFKLLYRETKECCSQAANKEDTVYDADKKPIHCKWKVYTTTMAKAGGIKLTESKQICTMAQKTVNSVDSDVRTADFFVYAEAPKYSVASYTKAINEIKFCTSTTTPGASIYYKTAKSTLMSGNKGKIPEKMATYDKSYQFKTTLTAGLRDIALDSNCLILDQSKLVSSISMKSTINGSKLAPSHRNHDREHAGRLRPADIGMATKSWYYVEVDQPVMGPDQRDKTIWNATHGPVFPDQDGNLNGELYDSQEITITTEGTLPISKNAQSGVTIKYAIEQYHCTDPDGSGPLTISSSMLKCPLSERAKITTQMNEFKKCNMYDPAHSCAAQKEIKAAVGTPAAATGACAALELVYNSTSKKAIYSTACQSWMGVKFPKEAQYVMTCNGLSESAAGTLAPYSGCEFQTYNKAAGKKPVVDISSQVYTFAEKDGLERSTTAMMEFEITVNAPTISPCGVPPGYWADSSKKLYYVGPTAVTLTSPEGPTWRKAIEGRADSKLWDDSAKSELDPAAKVTIHQKWSTSQYYSKFKGVELKQPGTATTTSAKPPKKTCSGSYCTGSAKNKYDWLADENDNGLGAGSTRYEYAYRGRLITGEVDTRLASPPKTANNGGTEHRPRLFNDAIPSSVKGWEKKDKFTVTEIGTLFTYASKPGLTNSPMSSCEYEIQTTPPDWFQSGEICKEVSGKLSIPVCLSPALFGSGFIFLYSEGSAEVHYELRDNSLAQTVSRESPIFNKWIQLVAKGSTFFYSLKSFAIKQGMWDSVEINQPFVVVTEVSRGAIPKSNLPSDVSSVVCRDCDVTNILFGKPGQFWGAEYTTVPSGIVAITMDFPGDWQEAFNECGDKRKALTAAEANTAYLITTVYLAYPFIPDPARGYARSASACSDFEVEIQQAVRDPQCKQKGDKDAYGVTTCLSDGVRQSWETGGETFDGDGKRLTCAGNASAVAPTCWRNTVPSDSLKRFRDTDSFTPPQPIRGQALRYSCKKLPFYLESWVVYGIAGNSLDTSKTSGGSCTDSNGKAGTLDCKKKCVPQKFLGDGTCDDGTNSKTSNANYNCVEFLYDKMDCFKLDASGGSTDLTTVFNTMYDSYDGPGCTNC